jgi:DNA-binding FrmR family transcriptional regulator
MNENSCCRKKERGEEEKKLLINRLSRIEGQIRGLRAMVEKDAYCPDILTQASAASAALNGFAKALMSEHIRTCVAEDVRRGSDETLDELLDTLQKWMK